MSKLDAEEKEILDAFESGAIKRVKNRAREIAHHRKAAEATFRKDEGKWRFVDGEMVKPKPVRREATKVGRNDPCPCGSGKKYKKCCALKAAE